MEAGDLPDSVLIAADVAMGAEHQIGKADGGQVMVFRSSDTSCDLNQQEKAEARRRFMPLPLVPIVTSL